MSFTVDLGIGTLCYQKHCIENGSMLLLIVPIFFFLLFLIYKDFISFRSKDEKKRFHKRTKGLKIWVIITRTMIALCLLAALGAPFTTEEVITQGDERIKLLIDSTESMNVFDEQLIDNVKAKLKRIPLEISQISSGRRSELGEGILKKIEGNDNLLIVSDGNNHFGKGLLDVGTYARISDTRLFALDISPVKNDAYVNIIGPSETIEGTTNKFKVTVGYIGSQPSFTLQVYIDEKLEFSGQNIMEKEILKTFGKGYHKITAKITLEDSNVDNNIFYKSVKSIEKPKIAFVDKSNSPMKEGLGKIYDMKTVSSLPSDISDYHAVVFNDIDYADLKNRVEDLTGYLLDGGGIFFVGGRKSFDKGDYKETLLESLLPVKIGTGKIVEPLQHNIVIVLDVSESFSDYSYKSGKDNSALDLGKGLAIKMMEDFRDDINVGLVAFASLGQIVSEPVSLKDNRITLIEQTKRLSKGEGTLIDQGLMMAEHALEKVKGTKNVILISDGKMGHIKEPHMPKVVTERMAEKGITVYTVGLPSGLYGYDINRDYMKLLAEIGNGNYFEPDESQFLNVFFGKPEEKDKVFSGSSNLAVIDKNHFITQNLDLNARVTGINFVLPKLGSRSLIFTGDGNPILNTWNFGLGRVVTLATDDGREWAGALLKKENSMLITRSINYAVGNPEKDKEIFVQSSDGYLGEENEIFVSSEKYPVSKELTFTKEGETLYKAKFNPDKEGYYQFFDALIAINSPREYYDLGLDTEIRDMVELSGGKMLDLDDDDVVDQIKSMSERKEEQRVDLKMYPLALGLMIFMIELMIRKIYEHKKYKF